MNKETLRKEILQKVGEYYKVAFSHKKFIPGETHIDYGGRVFDEKELVSLVNASLDFWLTAGRYAKQLEEALALFLGAKHSLLTNSGSSANLLAFMTLTSDTLGAHKIERGDEVITCAVAFPTTVSPVIQYGAVPVFVDVTLDTYNIDCTMLKQALSDKTKAVFIAHTLGNPVNLEKITNFCTEHNLWLIEDNCDALGSVYRGKHTGTFGHISTCSFYPSHHMTMGEGGAVVTSDNGLKNILISLRDWGRSCFCPAGMDNTCGRRFDQQQGLLPYGYDHKYIYSHFGYNLKVTEMQAAIGCAQIEKLPQFITARRKNHQYLLNNLRELEDFFIMPAATPESEPSWFGFIMTIRDEAGFTRTDLVRYLEEHRIQTRLLFAGNLIKHPAFDRMRKTKQGYRVVGELTNTDKIMNNTFWFGVYPGMTNENLDYIISSIQEFLKNCKRK